MVGRIKPANAEGKIIISAHLDTIFHAGDAEKHPFRIEEGYAYGLGIADCKGGVVTPDLLDENITRPGNVASERNPIDF